jgi:hypothetical protein
MISPEMIIAIETLAKNLAERLDSESLGYFIECLQLHAFDRNLCKNSRIKA